MVLQVHDVVARTYSWLWTTGSGLALLTGGSKRSLHRWNEVQGVSMTAWGTLTAERAPHLIHAAVAGLMTLQLRQAPRAHGAASTTGVLFRAAAGLGRAEGRNAARLEVGAGLLAARQLLASHLWARKRK